MIEEAVIFVVGKEECGLAPNLRIGGQGVKNLRDVPGAVIGRPVRVLAVGFGRDDPGYCGEFVAKNVLAEEVKEGSILGDVGAGPGLLE
jgi:hypothetical protein